jgi:hypothetical protein
MPALAFAIPLLPDKTNTARAALESFSNGERSSEYTSSRERLGITHEAVWIQQTPGGDVSVVYLESPDLEAALAGMANSGERFDRWFREHVRDIHGIALEDGFPLPQQVLDFHTTTRGGS